MKVNIQPDEIKDLINIIDTFIEVQENNDEGDYHVRRAEQLKVGLQKYLK